MSEKPTHDALDFDAIAKKALSDMPPETRFGEKDAEVIRKNADALLPLRDAFVKGFYDVLFAHEPTRAVFEEGERAEREKTLAQFYERVIRGPHDGAFFAWLAFVGPVHVVRGVTNPMMLAMLGYLVEFVRERSRALPDHEALVAAFTRLAATMGAIIAYGYEMAWKKALENVVGIPPALAERAAHEEATRLFPLRSHGRA